MDDPEHRRITVYPESEHRVTGYYLQRFSRLLQNSEWISLLDQHQGDRWFKSTITEPALSDHRATGVCRTEEQQQAVNAVIRVAKGHRRRPLVLTADRGRGKSSALGIAAAELLRQGLSRIVVTAPSLTNVEQVFQQAQRLLSDAEMARGLLQWQGKSIRFMAPDEVIAQSVDCELMLVDEAAALPVPLLDTLLRQQSRIVFSSTMHGYEGTGRGFTLRFRKNLKEVTPKYRSLHIHQAIRWADNDPLEQLVFSSLLLDATPASDELVSGACHDHCEWVQFDREKLAGDENLLRQVFGLLILAHYRTRPFDLRHFLDGPNIEVYGLLYNGRLVATVMAAREGGIEASLIEPVWLGQRRVRGHLIPQSLSNHVGIPEAITLRGLRILRVAVHSAVRRRGLGAMLLEQVRATAQERRIDYLGTSFGATSDLVDFWHHNQYKPVRVGLQREAASGCYSLMMLRPLSESGTRLLHDAQSRFYENVLLQLPESLHAMEPELVIQMFRSMVTSESERLTPGDWQDLKSFCNGHRLYESCLPALRRLTLLALAQGVGDTKRLRPLIAKILQLVSWSQLAVMENVTGKKQAESGLRLNVAQLLKTFESEEITLS